MLFGGLVAQSVRAVGSNPTPVCVGTTCTQTFSAISDYYTWTPPTGARNISFDLMGGQGGRSGGQGGRVTGTLNTVPALLYIYVGGAGNQGAGSAGGFNGGGTAGSGRGDEGSGGGATDLRTTTSLNDRLAVAAGGGGSGGFSGGAGGNGGGTIGQNGTSGQAQAGFGGTDANGGNGGFPNGGSWGTNGGFGGGGAGGSSSMAGGGGGGGGYYGGGGGGADTDTCCGNAGGGGGGSSWANSGVISSITHTAGYRAGAGMAIITYSMPPSANNFAATTALTNATAINYNLLFNESVTGLASTDFVMTGSTATCSTISVSGSTTTYLITVSGCGVGTLKLTLLANTVTGSFTGPATDKLAADVVIERTLPTVAIVAPTTPTNATTLQYSLTFSESVTGLAADDFSVTGASCSIGAVGGSVTSYTVQVSNCEDGATAQLSMLANSVSDLASNLGPAVAPTIAAVRVDRSAPVGTWATIAASNYVSPSFQITFAESVTGVTSADFQLTGAATNCVVSFTEDSPGLKFTIATTGCSDGTVQVSQAINSYTDALGNLGPATANASAVFTKVAQPAPAPAVTATPTPTATPVASPSASPAATPAPTSSAAPPVVSSPADPPSTPPSNPAAPTQGSAPNSESPNKPDAVDAGVELVAAAPVRKTYSFTPSVIVDPEPIAPTNPDFKIYDPQITVNNPTDPKPIQKSNGWQMYASLGLGAVSVALAGIGVIKGARQMRTRRLVRKFA